MRLGFFLFLSIWVLSTGRVFSLPASGNGRDMRIGDYLYSSRDTSVSKKRLIDKIKKAFKCKAKEREEKRMMAIIGKVFATDSSYRSITDLKKKSQELSGKQKADFDSLMGISSKQSLRAVMLQARIDSMMHNFISSSPGTTTVKNITDKEIDQMVAKMLPMVKEKMALEEADEKMEEKIRLIRRLIVHPEGIAESKKLSDTLLKKYTLRMGRYGEVFGYHPYWMKNNHLNYNFSLLTTLAFYGYELNGLTGGYKTLHGWDTVAVVTAAKRAGCKVELCVYHQSRAMLNAFLKNPTAQEKLALEVSSLLKKRNADGVNIMFEQMDKGNRARFTRFIRQFAGDLKQANAAYELTITVPVLDKNQNYDIKQLDAYVDRFVIDFSKKQKYGPIAPLKGVNYSLDAGIASYLSKGVPSSKFIACLPYFGALWDFQTRNFIDYIPYNRIVNSYLKDYRTVNDGNSARTDVVEEEQDTLQQLWYDDARTLSNKYALAIQNELGGIGIWALGYDNEQPELWNALMDKMVYIDTLDVKLIRVHPPRSPGLWASIKKELKLYKLLFQHPCDFRKDEWDEMKLDNAIGPITLVLVLLLLLVAGYAIAKNRALGDDWKNKKAFLRLLIFQVVLVMISVLIYCFLNPEFTLFGVSNGQECETSFGTILQVLGVGFLIGLFAMKFLVFPLMKRKDIP